MHVAGRCKIIAVHALACWVIATGACGLDWTVPGQTDSSRASDAGGEAASGTGAVGDGSGGSDAGANGASSSNTGAGASSGSSSGSGTASACDVGSCDACDECAAQNDCAALLQACADDPPCSPLAESCCVEIDDCVYHDVEQWQCMGDLSDTQCIEACYHWVYYPDESIELHRQLMQCILCDACATTCAGYQQASWLEGC